MNFKNGKKRIGLIALLSCVLTATVAFAAYTGYNYINGSVEVVGNPFKMVFADSNGNALEFGDLIPAVGHATVNGTTVTDDNKTTYTDIVSDLSVERADDGSQTIDGLKVRLSKKKDNITYTFKIANTGGAAAWLDTVSIAEFAMPKDGAGMSVSPSDGNTLDFAVKIDDVVARSFDGMSATTRPNGEVKVEPGSTVDVELQVGALSEDLFKAYDAAEETFGAEIALGKVTITWSAVPPEDSV